MAPKVARGGDGDADIAASPTSAKSTAMRMRGRVVLQGLILLHLVTASLASIDEFMTCDRILEKKRESRLLDEIPCDMSAKSYCEHKGNGYPEAQIWRFKEENRALMRRLYGDLESNSVYREMRASNMASAAASAKAEAKAASAKAASAKAEGDNNFPLDHDLFSSLEYNIRLGSGLATVQGSREQVVGGSEASKRRPPTKKKVKLIKKKRLKKKPSTEGSDGGGAESTTAEGGSEVTATTTSIPSTSTTTTSTTTTATTTTSTTTTATTTTTMVETTTLKPSSTTASTSTESTTTLTTTATTISTKTTANGTVTETTMSSSVVNSETAVATSETDVVATMLPETSVASSMTQVVGVDNDDGDHDHDIELAVALYSNYVDSAIFRTDLPPQDSQPSGSTAQSQVPGFTQLLAGVDLDSLEKYVGEILPKQGNENIESQEASAETIAQIGSAAAQVSGAEESDDMEEYEYEEVLEEVEVEVDGAGGAGGDADEGYGEGDIYTGASVNACPVKEEVFAPYWANNTRDQVLALLNLYPFEQYIHMETCKFPKEEMMCREGCRCEQQYRLHRLLAFDPSNECRGIFSDWFRFPSYCICKCYNLVEETFLFNKDRARAEKSLPGQTRKKAAEVASGAAGEHRNIPADFTQPRNIPAILPYEVKEALLRDMREDTTKLLKEEEEQSQAASSSSTSTPKPPAVSDNVVDVTEEEAKKSDHFFYGNAPVLEYRPTDGTSGRKTPR